MKPDQKALIASQDARIMVRHKAGDQHFLAGHQESHESRESTPPDKFKGPTRMHAGKSQCFVCAAQCTVGILNTASHKTLIPSLCTNP